MLGTPVPAAVTTRDSTSVPALSVSLDEGRHEVTLIIGPFAVPAMMDMPGMDHEHAMTRYSQQFDWPIDGFGRGFRLELTDAAGKPVSRQVLHHIVIENQARRQLMLPVSERLLAAGRETGNLMLPASIGLPLTKGSRMKAVMMWHNETGLDLTGVTLRLVIRYMPTNQMPRPIPALPFTFDVQDRLGQPNTFDIPPGHSETSRDFVMPVGGRLLGVSGHMHDYAVGLRLEEVTSGKVLIRLPIETDSTGRIVREGLKLQAQRRYRLVAVYQNPTEVTQSGAMAHLDGLLRPSNLKDWPAKGSQEIAYLDQPDSTKLEAHAEHHH